jgi:hypothetical protein
MSIHSTPQHQASSTGPTLQTFDLTTFNPANPESWATLAGAWERTTGRMPGQVELMQFLATGVVPDQGGDGAGMGGNTAMGMGMGIGDGGMGGMVEGRGFGVEQGQGY